jgi:hypothetical protein
MAKRWFTLWKMTIKILLHECILMNVEEMHITRSTGGNLKYIVKHINHTNKT